MFSTLVLAAFPFAVTAIPAPQSAAPPELPESADNGAPGGIFGIGLSGDLGGILGGAGDAGGLGGLLGGTGGLNISDLLSGGGAGGLSGLRGDSGGKINLTELLGGDGGSGGLGGILGGSGGFNISDLLGGSGGFNVSDLLGGGGAGGLGGLLGGGGAGGFGGSGIDLSSMFPSGPEYPKGPFLVTDYLSPGTGPYPAGIIKDAGLPNHTVYAPLSPPGCVKLPVLIWGNGGCTSAGTPYGAFLTEVASYGYIAIANGAPGPAPPGLVDDAGKPVTVIPGFEDGMSGSAAGGLMAVARSQSKMTEMFEAIDWVVEDNAARFGNVDTDTFITAGSSCGGLEAYSAAYRNPRVKLTVLYNSGLLDESKTYLLSALKAPVGYILGGPKDIAYENGGRDYENLPEGLPAFYSSLDSGHMGTFFTTHGGKYGAATVALLEWVLRGNETAKAIWTDPESAGSLVSQNWNVTHKNWEK